MIVPKTFPLKHTPKSANKASGVCDVVVSKTTVKNTKE
jgi:hypothetical protein